MGALASSLLLLAGAVGCAGQSGSAGEYMGREIADVMSYRGAPWLERDSREDEENTEAILAALPVELGTTAVDFGCGSGFYARRLAAMVGEDGRVLCVDIQPQMLEIAERRARDEGIANLETILAAEADPRLEPGVADLILLVDVYHELASPEPVLAGLRQALAPGGRVALVEYRLEGDTAAHVKRTHRMSVEQVMREWTANGFELVERIDTLPIQHLFLFRSARVN